MFCPNCGVKNPDEAKFCFGCGKPLPAQVGNARTRSSLWHTGL